MADDVDRCVFYWCLNGVLVSKTGGGKKLSCTEGKGTAPFSISQRDICTEANADCRSGTLCSLVHVWADILLRMLQNKTNCKCCC